MADDDFEDPLISSISSLSDAISAEPPSDPDLINTTTEISLRRLEAYKPCKTSDDTVKVLGAFINHLPLHGKKVMLHLVQEDTSDSRLYDIALHLTTAILIPSKYSTWAVWRNQYLQIVLSIVKASGGRTPNLSLSPFENATAERDAWVAAMLVSPTRNEQKHLKQICLIRDGYKCVLTGIWDVTSVESKPELNSNLPCSPTQLVHIIPFSLGCYSTDKEVMAPSCKVWWQNADIQNTGERDWSKVGYSSCHVPRTVPDCSPWARCHKRAEKCDDHVFTIARPFWSTRIFLEFDG